MEAVAHLLSALDAAVADLEALATRRELAPADTAPLIAAALAARARLARDEVVVAVVGETRAGKTTFLEAATVAGIPTGFRLVDTPGLNAGDPASEAAAWAIVREEADAVLLLSDLQQAVSHTTRAAVAEIGKLAPHVLLVLTKADRARQNAELAGDPEAEVAEARRVGVKRFAAEVGRPAADVLAVSVAAQPALRDETQAAFFRADLAPMWEVLRAERALVLAARAASTLEAASTAIRAAVGRAEGEARARVAALEAQRLPDPAAYRAEALAQAAPALADPEGWKQAARGFRVALARRGTRWEIGIRKGIDEDEVRQAADLAAAEAQDAITAMLADTRGVALAALAARAEAARERALAGLRARYRLVGEIAGAPADLPPPPPLDVAPAAAPLGASLAEALAAFAADRQKIQLGGAAAGAALGTVVAPGLGTALGALVGSLGGLFMTLDVLKDDALKALHASLDAAEASVMRHIVEGGAAAEAALVAAIGADVDLAMASVADRIDALLAAERTLLEAARADVADLLALGVRLEADLARLRTARAAAAAGSRGLVAT